MFTVVISYRNIIFRLTVFDDDDFDHVLQINVRFDR